MSELNNSLGEKLKLQAAALAKLEAKAKAKQAKPRVAAATVAPVAAATATPDLASLAAMVASLQAQLLAAKTVTVPESNAKPVSMSANIAGVIKGHYVQSFPRWAAGVKITIVCDDGREVSGAIPEDFLLGNSLASLVGKRVEGNAVLTLARNGKVYYNKAKLALK